ncbi:MAG: RimK family alpha-L-glutamate ligase [Pirellulales bacterium]|nr:RimK family alpha-L-glutamate ligase [Pirellulales bacterium]
MRIGVLSSPESWYLADLQRAAGNRHQVAQLNWRDIAATVGDQSAAVTASGIDLTTLEAVIVRTMPPGSLEQVIFRMDALGQLAAAGVLVVNAPRAIEVAIDKYLALCRMQAAGIDVPKTRVCQTPGAALRAWQELGGDVVVKPLFGSEGHGLVRVNDAGMAERTFDLLAQLGSVLYLQEFVPHAGFDLRLLVIGRRVLAMRRHAVCGDWRTNLSRGGRAEPVEIDDELASLAHRAAAAVGARQAGVDVLTGLDGRRYVLEVNAVPGWKGLSAALQIDVAKLVLNDLEQLAAKA